MRFDSYQVHRLGDEVVLTLTDRTAGEQLSLSFTPEEARNTALEMMRKAAS